MVNTIINYDLPGSSTIYIHRIGRSGRKNQKSKILNYAGPEDYTELKKIEKGLGREFTADIKYSVRHLWIKLARETHRKKVDRDQRLKEIKTKQGLL